MTDHWRKYQGALMWNGIPHEASPSQGEALRALKEQGGMFARWTSNWDCGFQTEWWYCICDNYTPIENLTAKQRYRVNKGLRLCQIVHMQKGSETLFKAIYELVKASFEDYPKAYRPNLHKETFKKRFLQLLEDKNVDIWLVYSHENEDELIGYCQCTRTESVVWLTQVKVPTKYLNMEVNAALVYKLCSFYLKEKNYKYICDGERNIKHVTNYQDFLVRVLNFRYAYCTLNVIYQWRMKLIINLLFPFRNIIHVVRNLHPFLYNVYCVLVQEQIRKTFNKKNT